MRRLREWTVRFGGLFNKQRKDWELDEEIERHLQLHIEDNVRLGMTPKEARRRPAIPLQVFELFLCQPGLLENGPECSNGHVGRVHRHIGLPTVGMPQHNMRAGLLSDHESTALQAGQYLTRLVGHPREVPRSKKRFRWALERSRDWLASPRSRVGPVREPRLERPRPPSRACLAPTRGYERSNGLAESLLPRCAPIESRSSCGKRNLAVLENQVAIRRGLLGGLPTKPCSQPIVL
jgi:hypothetical protein